MSKSKNPKYIAEGKRRMKVRKDARNGNYRKLCAEASELGCTLSGVKYGYWADPNSPTGYSQKCSYEAYGTCQSPCNGDC